MAFQQSSPTQIQRKLRADLRKDMLKRRKSLSLRSTQQAGNRAAITLAKHPFFLTAHSIGIYTAAFGEIDTQAIIQLAWRHGKSIWLPMVCAFNATLQWHLYTPNLARRRRRYRHPLGMYELRSTRTCHTHKLNLLIMPLLAADRQGNRLGMGGGFYDRTLAAVAPYSRTPMRLGLAYDFQLIEQIPAAPWDKRLHAVLTPNRLIRIK